MSNDGETVTTRRALIDALLLAALLTSLALPSLSTTAAWDATSYAGWPGVGLSAALFVATGPAGRWPILVVQTIGIGAVLSYTYEVDWWQGAAASLAVTMPALVAAQLLRPHTAAYRRFNAGEVDAYHGATAAVGLLCGILSAGAAIAAQRADLTEALLTGLISLFAATTAQLLLLPFWLREAGGWNRLGQSVELWAQRIMLVIFTLVVFLPHPALPVAFLIFPVLGWAAIRATAPETHLQVLVVSGAAFSATITGHGPLALGSIQDANAFAPLLVYAFIASICYLLVPLSLTVETLTAVTRQATGAATTVRRMLDSATGTVFIATDPAGRVTHYNSGAEQALGFSADEVLGRQTFEFHSEEEVARQAESHGIALSSKPSLYATVTSAQITNGQRRDWQFQRKDGQMRMVSLNMSAMTEPSGRVVGYIASGEDITERVRAQQSLEQAFQHEHDSAEALRAADDVKQELVSTVSHELRTPITNITGFAELLLDGDLGVLTDQQIEAVDRIERNSARLHQMVGDLLTLSSAESGTRPIVSEPVDLNEVISRAHEMISPLIARRTLTVRVQLAPAPVLVLGEPDLLERAVTNLWSNAVKFTPDDGTIELLVVGPHPGAHPGRATVTVRDTGMGIPIDEQSDVFTRFYRTAAAGEQAIQGTGLGLSIVRAVVDQHGGEVSLDSAPGTGTTIILTFPSAASTTWGAEVPADDPEGSTFSHVAQEPPWERLSFHV